MFVVTLPKSARKNPLSFARKARKAGADILEIRGDLTPRIRGFKSPLPILLSLRGALISRFSKINFEYLDLELNETIPVGLKRSVKIIRSFHDYKKTPTLAELKSIEKKLRALNPWAVKIAVTIRSYADLRTLEKFHDSVRGKRSVVLGMGPKAHVNRMLSPLKDALTYTYLEEGEQAAEGQVPLSLYRLIKHCKKPRLFGLLGGLDVRSLSPLIHNTLFKIHRIDALYFLALTDDLDDAWKNLNELNVEGFSVTSPWKRDIVHKLDSFLLEDGHRAPRRGAPKDFYCLGQVLRTWERVSDPRKRVVRFLCGHHPDKEGKKMISVNTAVKTRNIWTGYARDAEGLLKGYDCLRKAKSACVLGSGGVVPEVVRALRLAGISDIRIFARNASARLELATALKVGHGSLQEAVKTRPDIFICAINADISVPLASARSGAHAIDLRYGRQTKFLAAAKKAGYKIHDGLPMLLHQALAQFQLFTGMKPTEQDRLELRKVLHSLRSIP